MKLIAGTKLTGAKRLHRKYELEHKDNFVFSQPHEMLDDNIIEFASELESIFLEELFIFGEKQKQKQVKELRKKQKIAVKDAEGVQGSQEWLNSRLGLITASNTPFTSKGTKIPTFDTYINNKVAEKVRAEIGIERISTPATVAMELGNELEHLAIESYEKKTGRKVQTKGLVVGVENKIGASVDGVTVDDDFNKINIEVKTVSIGRYLSQLHSQTLSKEYNAQMQVQMYIIDSDTTDFLVQCSETDRLDLLITRVDRDEEFIYNLIETLKEFENEFDIRYEELMLKLKE